MRRAARAGHGARRGVALLLVLWLVVVLSAIGTTVAMTARGRLRVAANLRDRAAARAAAESGVLAAARACGRARDVARLEPGRAGVAGHRLRRRARPRAAADAREQGA